MEELKLQISCEGATTVELDELNELHHFKSTSDQQYANLRNSLTEFGFSFPFFIWIDPNNTKWILDGHRRKPTLIRMRNEGFEIPPLPAVIIHAKDKQEAAKKVVALESRYGDPNESDFTEFLSEFNIGFEDIENFMDIPGLDIDEKEKKPKKLKEHTCPSCGEVFSD